MTNILGLVVKKRSKQKAYCKALLPPPHQLFTITWWEKKERKETKNKRNDGKKGSAGVKHRASVAFSRSSELAIQTRLSGGKGRKKTNEVPTPIAILEVASASPYHEFPVVSLETAALPNRMGSHLFPSASTSAFLFLFFHILRNEKDEKGD